ncbi:precorrin-2 dehydrogenase/sirohydrochlorin ferrochelatase family protein [Carboxydothermus ferrireducens]|uniref:precorrin-2 dehydrogenase n=1 Tax=Carboxydothermus ferrireducens DSM 11255 TaxID=1119529 RepID=A0ABX2RA24_9THEO|nr:bifunctional precorrin-2 dehydrogenase/sirohydrochlorin ferrochelatase [Carboxydothermus ferrireducens]NYE56633.1 precorrin-2 dehydrogenase/sirohydrochlorin ferrochelatase [Carboxydothermus ferrireducens DSM 11255]
MYPISLNLTGTPVLVVGGGRVALRKVQNLHREGAKITVVAPKTLPELMSLAQSGQIKLYLREFQEEDLSGPKLVFAATDNSELNKRIANLCQRLGIWVNVADNPEESNFIVPAVWRRGGWEIAVGTSGLSPLAARLLKEELSRLIDPAWDDYLKFWGELRKALKESNIEKNRREEILKEVAKIYDYRKFCREKPSVKLILEKFK